MEVKASDTYLRISPRKLRLLTYGLNGLSAKSALERVEFYPQRGKDFLKKLLKQAIANAVNNFKLNKESLFVKKIEVGDGPRSKRQDTSHGARFDRGVIHKKTAHLYLVLDVKETPLAEISAGKVEKEEKRNSKKNLIKKSKEKSGTKS